MSIKQITSDVSHRPRIGRRAFTTGLAALTLASPAIAQGSRGRTLVVVPQSNLSTFDVIYSVSLSTTNHAYAVFDTLYGVDSQYRPHPQMAEGHTVSDDQRTWFIRLRPGLKFHDGQPVLARDCAASILRWSKRNSFGSLLAANAEVIDSTDDRTIRLRMKRPFPQVVDALAHPIASPCIVMPERLALTPATTQVTEMIGSGPYRFLKDEYVSGSHVGYAKFTDYVPRDEQPDLSSGRKEAHFDRLEWHVIPDAATAASGLMAGEVDLIEIAAGDLVPLLTSNQHVTLASADPAGFTLFARLNCLQPPFSNPKLRQIFAAAVNQPDYLEAINSGFPGAYKTCYAQFQCGLPGVQEVGAELMGGPKDMQHLRAAVKDAGYNGEKVVVLNATDISGSAAAGPITADILGKLGMTVDLQDMDFGTLIMRRASQEPSDKGGWSVFHSIAPASTLENPVVNFLARGRGKSEYIGWYSNPAVEQLVDRWLFSPDTAERSDVMNDIQRLVFEDPPTIPMGHYFPRTAFRSDLSGFLPGPFTPYWNIRRA